MSASRGKTAFTAVGKKLFLNHFPDGTGTTRAVIFSPVDELQDQYLRKDVVELKSSNSILMMCLDAACQSVLTILARVVCLAQYGGELRACRDHRKLQVGVKDV